MVSNGPVSPKSVVKGATVALEKDRCWWCSILYQQKAGIKKVDCQENRRWYS